MGDLGHLENKNKRTQENRGCVWLFTDWTPDLHSFRSHQFGVEVGVGVDSEGGDSYDDLGPKSMVK